MSISCVILRVRRGASILAALALAGVAMPASAAGLLTADDLAPLVDGLTAKTATLDTAVGLLRADTTGNTDALSAQAGLLTGLRTDLGGVRANVADLDVRIGDLRGLVDGLPDLAGLQVIDTLNAQVLTNTGDLAKVDVSIKNVLGNEARQDARIDDHERRISETTTIVNAQTLELADHERRIAQNSSDIGRHEQLIGDLQSRMASGFAGIDAELRRQDRRIGKATEGVAMALAMKSPAVPEDKNFALSGSFGAFDSKAALAVAGGVRATDALQFDAGIAVGLDRGSIGGRAGATLAW